MLQGTSSRPKPRAGRTLNPGPVRFAASGPGRVLSRAPPQPVTSLAHFGAPASTNARGQAGSFAQCKEGPHNKALYRTRRYMVGHQGALVRYAVWHGSCAEGAWNCKRGTQPAGTLRSTLHVVRARCFVPAASVCECTTSDAACMRCHGNAVAMRCHGKAVMAVRSWRAMAQKGERGAGCAGYLECTCVSTSTLT